MLTEYQIDTESQEDIFMANTIKKIGVLTSGGDMVHSVVLFPNVWNRNSI